MVRIVNRQVDGVQSGVLCSTFEAVTSCQCAVHQRSWHSARVRVARSDSILHLCRITLVTRFGNRSAIRTCDTHERGEQLVPFLPTIPSSNHHSRHAPPLITKERTELTMAIIQEAYISEEIHELKAQANRKFTAKDYDGALSIYLDILSQLPAREPSSSTSQEVSDEVRDEQHISVPEDDAEGVNEVNVLNVASTSSPPPSPPSQPADVETEEHQQIRLFRSIIYANIAATHLRLEQYRDAVKASNQSLLDQPNYVKALYRRAQANEQIGGWSSLSSALEDSKLLLTLPDLSQATKSEIMESIKRLEPKAQQAAEKEKDEMIQKLKGLGDSILGNFGLSTNNFKLTQQPGGGYSMNFVR